MKLLIESGLYGGGLFSVNNPELVRRYNACLQAIGQKETNLECFHIDAIGWSPEIANETGRDIDYLSIGMANRFAIVITPEQSGLPVYRPVHSFDRVTMEMFFDRAKAQIGDITRSSGIWLDFSHELIRFTNPLDLLTIEWITIVATDSSGLMSAAAEQRKLAQCFMANENAWADPEIRDSIIQSATKDGDLRFRSLLIPDLKFTDVRTFYSRAFGGTYVFRDITKVSSIILMEDKSQMGRSDKNALFCSIEDTNLPAILEEQDIVDVPLGSYKNAEGEEKLQQLYEYLFIHAYYSLGGEEDVDTLSDPRRRQWLVAHENEIDPVIFELERLALDLKRGAPVRSLTLSQKLRTLLFQPSRVARKSEIVERVVLHLISRLAPENIDVLFSRNRLYFYTLYNNWPQAKKEWAVKHLVQKGHAHWHKKQ